MESNMRIDILVVVMEFAEDSRPIYLASRTLLALAPPDDVRYWTGGRQAADQLWKHPIHPAHTLTDYIRAHNAGAMERLCQRDADERRMRREEKREMVARFSIPHAGPSAPYELTIIEVSDPRAGARRMRIVWEAISVALRYTDGPLRCLCRYWGEKAIDIVVDIFKLGPHPVIDSILIEFGHPLNRPTPDNAQDSPFGGSGGI
jgi:hypothetical protein